MIIIPKIIIIMIEELFNQLAYVSHALSFILSTAIETNYVPCTLVHTVRTNKLQYQISSSLAMLLLLFFVLLIALAIVSFKLYLLSIKGINTCSKHLIGKTVIVTGGNNGIGFETAKDLAGRGARVIIGCRSEVRGTTARDKIVQATENEDVHYRHLDLASLTSVRKFAEEIIKTEKRLDILINNAGVVEGKKVHSEDGLLLGMQINYFGPFLLTNLLLSLIKSTPSSRIINVSSTGYRFGDIDIENLNMEKETDKSFSPRRLYCNSKLSNILMTIELSRRLQGTGVTTNALHPGAVATNIANDFKQTHIWMKLFDVFSFLVKNAWEGAQTTIYLAVSPEVRNVSGKYFTDCRVEETTSVAKDTEVAKKLWEVSEKLVKLT